MRSPAADTSQEERERQVQAWRGMEGAERLRLALDLSDEVQALALAGLRSRFPDESDSQLRQRLIAKR